jgi:nucleotide-binding universal stress UspA family protein
MVRRLDVPVLVTGEWTGRIRKVLAAVDLSSAASPTIAAAERFADLYDATLKVLHAVEPLPIVDGVTLQITPGEMMERSKAELETGVWPLIARPGTDHIVREGPATDTIARAVAESDADLLVVGSHGRGWVDRLLLGSVTEQLLSRLPTSMLIVPVSNVARDASRAKRDNARRQAQHALAR